MAQGTNLQRTIGNVSHDGADTGAPVKIGGKAATALPSAVSASDRVDATFTTQGQQLATIMPNAIEGLDIYRTLDLDETEEEVKASAGNVYGWFLFNAAAATTYVKFYNATAASVSVGTTTPVLTIPIPAGAGANLHITNGLYFSTAICIAATTGVADADVTGPGANELIANIFYL